jgi:mutator protein MutT
VVRIDVVAAIVRRGDEILITQRGGDVHLAHLWEFPGGKVETGESLQMALEREIQEEIGVKIQVGSEILTVDHDYPTKSVRLHFFHCTILEGAPQALEVADFRWVKPEDLILYEFPAADDELIVKLRSTR